jgi:antirestriction protein ArdC
MLPARLAPISKLGPSASGKCALTAISAARAGATKVTAARNSLRNWDLLFCAPTSNSTWNRGRTMPSEVLKNDNRAIFAAAAHAQRAADYLNQKAALVQWAERDHEED